MDVWLVMLIIIFFLHCGDIATTWWLFYYKRKYHWHIRELNPLFSWWIETDGWPGQLGFIGCLEIKLIITLVAYLLTTIVSEYFGIVFSIFFGATFLAIFMNLELLGSTMKSHNRAVESVRRVEDCGGFIRIGLVDSPRCDDGPTFIGKTDSDPTKRYLWWVGFKGGL